LIGAEVTGYRITASFCAKGKDSKNIIMLFGNPTICDSIIPIILAVGDIEASSEAIGTQEHNASLTMSKRLSSMLVNFLLLW
jgi:hypothetical protein